MVWKDITGKISGKQEIIASVISPHRDNFLGAEIPIIDNTLLGIPVKNLDEAHYLCALLNSLSSRIFVLSYTHLHVRPYVIQKLNLREYAKNNHSHTKLSELSKKAHALAKRYYEQKDLEAREELEKVEGEIDKVVAELYGITDEELEEVRKTVRVLKGEEVESALDKKIEKDQN